MKTSTLLAWAALLGLSLTTINAYAAKDCPSCVAAKTIPNAPKAPVAKSVKPVVKAEAQALEASLLPADPTLWAQGTPITQWAPGKVYLLEFWASWCGPCREAIPHMQQLHTDLKDHGLHIIGVNLDRGYSAEKARQFMSKQPKPATYDLVLGLDSALVKTIKPRGIPYSVILKDGNILWTGHPASITKEMIQSFINK